jgi:hypothetical protein
MKTSITKTIVAAMMAVAVAVTSIAAQAEMQDANGLVYNNRASAHAIHNSPNSIADQAVDDPQVIYVNRGYGQAIYSYPSNIEHQIVDLEVDYMDKANGQAIHSYPNNNGG